MNRLILLVMFSLSSMASAGTAPRQVRITTAKSIHEGKVISLTKHQCSLVERSGRLVHLNVRDIRKLNETAPRFQPLPHSTFRGALLKEFPGYDVSGTNRYLVCGPKTLVKKYAALFDSVYRDVFQFFRVRGFEVKTPDVPLVAVVFSSQKEFLRYCVKDKVPPTSTLRGYYSLLSNRVVLYDQNNGRAATVPDVQSPWFRPETMSAFSGISADTASTIIHETTHQVGYNIGVHSRLGGTPTWIVEGLATVLEPKEMRKSTVRGTTSQKVNAGRKVWFEQRLLPKRPEHNLAKLVASDEYFSRDTLGSYSEAWAFTFYMLDNAARRQRFARYLKKVEGREPTVRYTARQRLADFEDAFGDIKRVEVDFLRYMDRL